MYIPPILLSERQIEDEIIKQTDDAIMYEVTHQIGMDIDKEELIKALNYDRDQYNEGYRDGYQAALHTVKDRLGDIL